MNTMKRIIVLLMTFVLVISMFASAFPLHRTGQQMLHPRKLQIQGS